MTEPKKAATRSESKQAYEHVLDNVLQLEKEDGLRYALAEMGVENIVDLVTIDERDFDMVTWTQSDPDNPKETYTHILSVVQKNKIKMLIEWHIDESDNSLDSWNNLDNPQFNDYCLRSKTRSNATPKHQTDALNQFKKGVKRSISDYKDFKEDKYFISWYQNSKVISTANEVSEVFDEHYVPRNAEETSLFKAKQAFVYSMLEQKIQTSRGRIFVRQHSETLDAQSVLIDLVNAYAKGTSAEINIARLCKEIQEMMLDNKWKKPVMKFLQVWTLKILDLERILGQNIPNEDKRTWLTASLQPNVAMTQAITNARTLEHVTGTGTGKMDFDKFYHLVEDTATNIDEAWKAKNKQQHAANQGQQNRNNNNRNNNNNNNNNGNSGDKTKLDPNKSYPDAEYRKFTPQQKAELYKLRKAAKAAKKRNQQANQANQTNQNAQQEQQNQDNQASTTPPSTSSAMVPLQVTFANRGNDNSSQLDATHGSGIWSLLSNAAARNPASDQSTSSTVYLHEGNLYRPLDINMHKLKYHIAQYAQAKNHLGTLVDSGANGGMSGEDVRVLETSLNTADVTGIAQNEVSDLPISTVAGLIQTASGPVIGIFHQYAHYGKGKTIHSANQLRDFGIIINDIPRGQPNGEQMITTPEGYKIPLSIRTGLAYMDMVQPSDDDLEAYPHVFFTSDEEWNPGKNDNEFSADDITEDNEPYPTYDNRVNEYGEVIHEVNNQEVTTSVPETTPEPATTTDKAESQVLIAPANEHRVLPKRPDYAALRPNFGWINADRVRDTLENTTQLYKADERLPLRSHYRSRFPAHNSHSL